MNAVKKDRRLCLRSFSAFLRGPGPRRDGEGLSKIFLHQGFFEGFQPVQALPDDRF
jgi:hypothetical protein